MTGEARNELTRGCIVCGPGTSAISHDVPEAMFRSGEHFTYVECRLCGTLQIAHVPDDLQRYYGRDYYSFERPNGRVAHPMWRTPPGRAALRIDTALYNRWGVGVGITWARRAGIGVHDRVLDLGCGGGENLFRMHVLGYRRLSGADPFLDHDTLVAPGVHLWKRRHDEIEGEFDWIMMHHAFEHVPDPVATLESMKRLLAHSGRVLLRVPLVGGWAWRRYGSNWAQIDAPRHLVLYSLRGLRRLVEQAGFEVEQVAYDSWAFQFWASELAERGVPFADGPAGFTESELARWSRRATELNRALDGDQAAIVIRPDTSVQPA